MIKNERQYRASQSQRDVLIKQLAGVAATQADWIVAATRAALQSQILELDAELAAYDELRSAVIDLRVVGITDLPNQLIRARIASGWSQKELADRVGLKEQQIQRYEATDYAGASIARLELVMKVLGVTFTGRLSLQSGDHEASRVKQTLASLGFSNSTIKKRFFGSDSLAPSGPWASAAARTARIFKSELEDVLSGSVKMPANAAALRVLSAANKHDINGYAVYAEFLARTALAATTAEYRPLPPVERIRKQLGGRLSTEPLHALLELCWEHGIPVVPLGESGKFYGACWSFDGRPVIALNNPTRSREAWAHALAHEMDHCSKADVFGALESDIRVKEYRHLPAELAAEKYASDLLLGGKADALVDVALDRAGHMVSGLESAVLDVAEAADVSPALLADYVAYRVDDETGVKWWATAKRMHSRDVDAWVIARSFLFGNVELSRINALDRDIFIDGMAP